MRELRQNARHLVLKSLGRLRDFDVKDDDAMTCFFGAHFSGLITISFLIPLLELEERENVDLGA